MPSIPEKSKRKSPIHAPTKCIATSHLANGVGPALSSVPTEIMVVGVQEAGAQKELSPMTERWKNDDESIGNTTISTITLPEDGEALQLLGRKDDDSVGDEGSLDAEGKGGFEVGLLEEAAFETVLKQRDNDNSSIEENVQDCDENYTRCLPGAPENWEPPSPTDDWLHTPDVARGKPQFALVDNPGGWSPYTFQAIFLARGKSGKDLYHEILATAQVVPKNSAGERTVNGWTFHYKGWRHHLENGDFWRKNATRDNIFPAGQKSKLDADLLKRIKQRKVTNNAKYVNYTLPQ